MFFHLQRLVVSAVGSRLALRICIDTEEGEVACVARPHPVVRISAELADAGRRSTYHTDVAVGGLDKSVVAIATIERIQQDALTFTECDVLVVQETFRHFLQVAWRKEVGALWVGILLQLLHHIVGHVQNLVDEGDGQTTDREFLCFGARPETVGQIVVLHAALLLDSAIATVVVGDDQSFSRDYFSCAAAAEVNHCIF